MLAQRLLIVSASALLVATGCAHGDHSQKPIVDSTDWATLHMAGKPLSFFSLSFPCFSSLSSLSSLSCLSPCLRLII